MNYRSIKDLNHTILQSLHLVPRDVDLIAGVPRSGLLAANILALHLNLPLADTDGLKEGRILGYGRRYPSYPSISAPPDFKSFKKVLIVDDSIGSGETMRKLRGELRELSKEKKLIFAAVYAAPAARSEVDIAFEDCEFPRVFEWNVMHHPVLAESCVDIDGVLCREPSQFENDDGENYLRFLETAEPLVIPSVKVGWLVTSRLEKYRAPTEDWLKRNGVKYGELVMMDLPDRETRIRLGSHGQFKASVYNKKKARLFIESSDKQSREIAELSGKRVICFDTNEMISPDSLRSRVAHHLSSKKRAVKEALRGTLVHRAYSFMRELI